MTQVHAQFSPSKLPRIIECPGSAFATIGDPAASNVYADQGTRLHLIISEVLDANEYQVPYFTKVRHKMEQEEIEWIDDCLAYIFDLHQQYAHSNNTYFLVETKASLAKYATMYNCPELEDVYGTLDYAFFVPSEKECYIIDWKFGAGVAVHPSSHQLSAYALGAIKQLSTYEKIHKVIFQPRISLEPQIETVTSADMLKWLEYTLVPALIKTRAKHPIYKPSVNTCRFCPIKLTCAARREHIKQLAVQVFEVHGTLPDPADEEITRLLDQASTITRYLEDIKAYAVAKILNGQQFPGYKLVSGRQTRIWKDEESAKLWLSIIGLKEDDLFTKKFVSPAQAEKKVGKQWKKHSDFLALIDRKEGNPALVPEHDKRPPLVFDTPEEKFKNYC